MRHRGVRTYLADHLAHGLGPVAWAVGLVLLRTFAFVPLAVASGLPALIVAGRSRPR
ncbi:hypothetical protein ACFV5G_14805 [Streptomyces sp. NPDC059766]|uniref:hypothetical protein n=1 Tax=Streptomyces sp. NPDC059766 TaxID=3346940 RepID=UPI00365645F5